MIKYDRKYFLSVGQLGQSGFEISDLDIDFTIKKTIKNDKKLNSMQIKIINLDTEYRDILSSKKNLVLIFKAGYKDDVTTIFEGKITKSSSKHTGIEYETNIEAVEGFLAARDSKVSKSFPAGTNALKIVNFLCSEFLKSENEISMGSIYNSDILSSKIYRNGYSCCGLVRSELANILASVNMCFSIENNLLFVSANEKATQMQGILLDYSSGLITAEKTKNDPVVLKEEKKPVDGVNFEAFLTGGIKILSMIKIDNEKDIKAAFKVVEVEHKGIYLSGDWITKGFCVEVS